MRLSGVFNRVFEALYQRELNTALSDFEEHQPSFRTRIFFLTDLEWRGRLPKYSNLRLETFGLVCDYGAKAMEAGELEPRKAFSLIKTAAEYYLLGKTSPLDFRPLSEAQEKALGQFSRLKESFEEPDLYDALSGINRIAKAATGPSSPKAFGA